MSVEWPETATDGFRKLAETYRQSKIRYPHLKAITLAQWAVESGWGKSDLAKLHNNYAGMKWRKALSAFGAPVVYRAHDGTTRYASFPTLEHFIEAYWRRLDDAVVYQGWHTAAKRGAVDFIHHIGFPWLGMGDEAGRDYIEKILRIAHHWTEDFMKD